MIIDKINKYLSSKNYKINDLLLKEVKTLSAFNFKRQFMENNESSTNLRMSASGGCTRKLAYRYLGFEPLGKEINARGKMTFFMGDLVELVLLKLAKLSGCHVFATGLNQIEIKTTIEGIEIRGHPDGVLLDNGKLYLVECKSMSDYSYRDFNKNIIGDSYIAQVNMYMELLGLDSTVFIAMDKNNSVMGEQIVNKDPKIVSGIISKFKTVIKSTKDKLPDREFFPNKKNKLPWQCAYCSFWAQCYPQAEQKVVGNSYQLFLKSKESKK